MIGLDTNVLVRYIAQDDEPQFRLAEALIDALTVEDPGFISLVTTAELVWVIERSYRLKKQDLLGMMEMLLRMPAFVFEEAEIVHAALRQFAGSAAGFSDCLIERSAAAAGCVYTVTFDERASSIAGMRLLT